MGCWYTMEFHPWQRYISYICANDPVTSFQQKSGHVSASRPPPHPSLKS